MFFTNIYIYIHILFSVFYIIFSFGLINVECLHFQRRMKMLSWQPETVWGSWFVSHGCSMSQSNSYMLFIVLFIYCVFLHSCAWETPSTGTKFLICVFTHYLANKCDSDSDMVFSQQVKLYYTCILLYFCCIRFCNFAVVEFCHAVVVCMVVLIFVLKNTSYQVPPPDGKHWKPGWTNPCRY